MTGQVWPDAGAHGRRRFHELHPAGASRVATPTVKRMADLWKLEAEVRRKSPEARAAARQAVSAPIVAGLITLWQQALPRISGKSRLAEALCQPSSGASSSSAS